MAGFSHKQSFLDQKVKLAFRKFELAAFCSYFIKAIIQIFYYNIKKKKPPIYIDYKTLGTNEGPTIIFKCKTIKYKWNLTFCIMRILILVDVIVSAGDHNGHNES